jgi:uracil-DNA glycosylase family 4
VNGKTALRELEKRIVRCRRCPRLVEWRERVAAEKRAAFVDWQYWGRPVPGFGDPAAAILIVGLAPAAHGANRTGRMFTGDRSGDFLYAALHRAGLANQPESQARDDGLELDNVYITAAVRCAPPANKPSANERDNCRAFLERELEILHRVRVILALGGYAFDHVSRILRDRGRPVRSSRPRFTHGQKVEFGGQGLVVLGSYHPSQQNTFTGRLTPAMLDTVLARAVALAARGG